jgi:hypothetical protein
VLERWCEGAEQRGERDRDRLLLNVLGRTTEGKRGRQGGPRVGAAWRAGTGKKRGPGHGGGMAWAAGIGPQVVGAGDSVAAQ